MIFGKHKLELDQLQAKYAAAQDTLRGLEGDIERLRGQYCQLETERNVEVQKKDKLQEELQTLQSDVKLRDKKIRSLRSELNVRDFKVSQKPLHLLVIEDQPQHLQDVKDLMEERRSAGISLQVDYCSTLDAALDKLTAKPYDGIMSDVFFPRNVGGAEEASGTAIADYAMQHKVPFVLVTSTYHHESRTNPVNERMRSYYRPFEFELVDREKPSATKNWKGGFLVLAYALERQREVGQAAFWDPSIRSELTNGYTQKYSSECNVLVQNVANSMREDPVEGETERRLAAHANVDNGWKISGECLQKVLDTYCNGWWKLEEPEPKRIIC